MVEVPPIIDRGTYDAVQAHLQARNPKKVPPRVVSGPTLLTGLIHCAKCGGAMTIRTGKGGQYRYYACSTKARQADRLHWHVGADGETGRSGRKASGGQASPAPPDWKPSFSAVLDRRQELTSRKRAHVADLNKRATETDLRKSK